MNKQALEIVKSKNKGPLWYMFEGAIKAIKSDKQPGLYLESLNLVLSKLSKENLTINRSVKYGYHAGKTNLWQALKLAELGCVEPLKAIKNVFNVTELDWNASDKSGRSALLLLFLAALEAIKAKNQTNLELLIQMIREVVNKCSKLDFNQVILFASKLSKKDFPEVLWQIVKNNEQQLNNFNWEVFQPESKKVKRTKSSHVRKPTPLYQGSKSKSHTTVDSPNITNTPTENTLEKYLNKILQPLPILDESVLNDTQITAIVDDICKWDSYIMSQINLDDDPKLAKVEDEINKLKNWFYIIVLKMREKPYEKEHIAFQYFVENLVAIRDKLEDRQKYNACLTIFYSCLNITTIYKMIEKHIVKQQGKDGKNWLKENFEKYEEMLKKGQLSAEQDIPTAFNNFQYLLSKNKAITPFLFTIRKIQKICDLSKFVEEMKRQLANEALEGEHSNFYKLLKQLPTITIGDIDSQYDFTIKDWIRPTNSKYHNPLRDFCKLETLNREEESPQSLINSNSQESSSSESKSSNPKELANINTTKMRHLKKDHGQDPHPSRKDSTAPKGHARGPQFKFEPEFINQSVRNVTEKDKSGNSQPQSVVI